MPSVETDQEILDATLKIKDTTGLVVTDNKSVELGVADNKSAAELGVEQLAVADNKSAAEHSSVANKDICPVCNKILILEEESDKACMCAQCLKCIHYTCAGVTTKLGIYKSCAAHNTKVCFIISFLVVVLLLITFT